MKVYGRCRNTDGEYIYAFEVNEDFFFLAESARHICKSSRFRGIDAFDLSDATLVYAGSKNIEYDVYGSLKVTSFGAYPEFEANGSCFWVYAFNIAAIKKAFFEGKSHFVCAPSDDYEQDTYEEYIENISILLAEANINRDGWIAQIFDMNLASDCTEFEDQEWRNCDPNRAD